MKYIFLISLGLILLTGINLEWEFLSNRMLRLSTSWLFFGISIVLLLKNKVASIPVIALLLLGICDIFLWNWELELAKPMYYTIHSLASITFIFSLYWKSEKPPLSKYDWLYMLTITAILSWVMITLGHFFSEEISDPVSQVLFYMNGFLSVILSISAFIYSANSTDNHSSYFLLAFVGLTISDLFLFMIYIMDFLDLRYIDNFLNIFGCALLVKYMMARQKSLDLTSGSAEVNTEDGKNLNLEPVKENMYF